MAVVTNRIGGYITHTHTLRDLRIKSRLASSLLGSDIQSEVNRAAQESLHVCPSLFRDGLHSTPSRSNDY